MTNTQHPPIGAYWLIQFAGITPWGELPVKSILSTRRATTVDNNQRLEVYQQSNRPDESPAAHLQFHLRHEIPQLEFLRRLFIALDGEFIQAWVNAQPTGQYARRSAFLYEWLTDKRLQVPKDIGGNYVDALDSQKLVTASPNAVVKNKRWRVNDNIAGTRDFAPTILKDAAFNQAISLDIPHAVNTLNDHFGMDFIQRSSTWLTLGESRASFRIEGEANQTNAIERFAHVIETQTGQGELPLTPDALAQLQEQILGSRSVIEHYGIRQSPVFIGQTQRFQEVVHYIAPLPETLGDKLNGLQAFWDKTQGQSPIMRAGVVAFGLVYIHPLADGNGRVHRFLFNDLLRRDGALPESVILPISGVISESSAQMNRYANVLDEVSKPLMNNVRDRYHFSNENTRYPDGIVSNFIFDGTQQAEPLWSHPNLTPHLRYFSEIIEKTLNNMHEEAHYLHCHKKARTAIKTIIDMPNHYADRIIRSIRENDAQRSNKLSKELAFLQDDDLWHELVEVVQWAFHA